MKMKDFDVAIFVCEFSQFSLFKLIADNQTEIQK